MVLHIGRLPLQRGQVSRDRQGPAAVVRRDLSSFAHNRADAIDGDCQPSFSCRCDNLYHRLKGYQVMGLDGARHAKPPGLRRLCKYS